MTELTHFDENGNARMVDVTEKSVTDRVAIASGIIKMSELALSKIVNKEVKKGDVLTVAQVGGIMAAKKTSDLIPMAHPIGITGADLTFEVDRENSQIKAICTVKVSEKTGVEMEALTGVSMSLLTIYDMVKAVDKTMEITDIKLEYKDGGKSGKFKRNR